MSPWIIILVLSLYAPQEIKIEPTPTITPTVTPTPDFRVKNLEDFLKSHNSPLASSSADFIEIAEEANIDYRILVGIAKAESGFERAGNTTDYNPFGYNCPGTRPCQRFSSFKDAITKLTQTLKTHKAYTRFRETGKLQDLAESYLKGNKIQWETTVRSIINQLEK